MYQIRLKADYESARSIGPWLRTTLETLASPQLDRVGELELAIHEVAINIVDHAYADCPGGASYTITLAPGPDPNQICAELHDQGLAYVPAQPPNLDEPQIRGYGMFIAEQLASSVSYKRTQDTNVWTLIFSSSDSTLQQETP